jgi:ribosomal protein L12E/L44/L45/RPP1/RPP2
MAVLSRRLKGVPFLRGETLLETTSDQADIQLIAEGSSKFASIPSGGAGGASSGAAAAAPAAGGAAAADAPKEEAKAEEKEESDDDMVSRLYSCDIHLALLTEIGLRSVRLIYSDHVRVRCRSKDGACGWLLGWSWLDTSCMPSPSTTVSLALLLSPRLFRIED